MFLVCTIYLSFAPSHGEHGRENRKMVLNGKTGLAINDNEKELRS